MIAAPALRDVRSRWLAKPDLFLVTLLGVALMGTSGGITLKIAAASFALLVNAWKGGMRQGLVSGLFASFFLACLSFLGESTQAAGGGHLLRSGLLIVSWILIWLIVLPLNRQAFRRAEPGGERPDSRDGDGAPEGFWVVDADWRTLHVAPRVLEWLGLSQETLQGKDIRYFCRARRDPRSISRNTTFQDSQELSSGQICEILRSDGSTFFAKIFVSRLQEGRDGFKGCLIFFEKIQESLTRSSGLTCDHPANRNLFWEQSELVGVMTANVEGTILEANDLFLKMIGYTRRELEEGKVSWSVLTPPDFVPNDNARGGGESTRPYERQLLRKDGTRVSILLDTAGLESSTRTWVGVTLDLSSRKRAEQESRAARDAAEADSKAKDEFLGRLSHELRTPLTPVLLMATAMLDDPDLPEELRAFLELTRRNLDLETQLIDELLDITRINRGKLRLRRETVDVHQVIRHALETCRDDFRAMEITVALDLQAEQRFINGDATRLQQVFWNLFKNAAKFSPRNSQVEVRSRNKQVEGQERGGFGLVIEVQDHGIGIEPQLLPRVFNAFEQGEAGIRHPRAGLGLGLAISHSVVSAHGGHLEAHSDGPSRGSTFAVHFAPALASPRRNNAPGRLLPRARRPLQILLAEDNAETRVFLRRMLADLSHNVTAVDSLAAALIAVEGQTFDLLISDIELSDGSGLELMRTLGGRFVGTGIALSGFGSDEDVRLSKEAGFADHLTKPVDFRRLEHIIELVTSPLKERVSSG